MQELQQSIPFRVADVRLCTLVTNKEHFIIALLSVNFFCLTLPKQVPHSLQVPRTSPSIVSSPQLIVVLVLCRQQKEMIRMFFWVQCCTQLLVVFRKPGLKDSDWCAQI